LGIVSSNEYKQSSRPNCVLTCPDIGLQKSIKKWRRKKKKRK